MRNIKLTIEYDGTNYAGWQIQPQLRTIQEEIESAIQRITKEAVKINGSGRTDSGVHARGQVANFHTQSRVPDHRFKFALNSILPRDIAIKHSEEVPDDFHARYNAIGKTYTYLIYNGATPSPLLRNYAYYVPYPLDFEAMQKAAKVFVGTFDFCGFMSTGSSVQDTVRTIHDLTVHKREDVIEIKVTGNGFLYNMVRIISGTLIQVGNHKINASRMEEIILSKDRRQAGPTAPALGLYLDRVYYKDDEREG